jgi:hypothetical protein
MKQFFLVILFFSSAMLVFPQSKVTLDNAVKDFAKVNLRQLWGILKYSGYRPTEDDFWNVIHYSYFQDQIDFPEVLILTTFSLIENNTVLDERIKTFMRINELTCCETSFVNNDGGYSYIVNYSFDNYETFGYISIDSHFNCVATEEKLKQTQAIMPQVIRQAEIKRAQDAEERMNAVFDRVYGQEVQVEDK